MVTATMTNTETLIRKAAQESYINCGGDFDNACTEFQMLLETNPELRTEADAWYRDKATRTLMTEIQHKHNSDVLASVKERARERGRQASLADSDISSLKTIARGTLRDYKVKDGKGNSYELADADLLVVSYNVDLHASRATAHDLRARWFAAIRERMGENDTVADVWSDQEVDKVWDELSD